MSVVADHQDIPRDPIRLLRAVVLDVETTGLDAERDEVVELAFIMFDVDCITGRVHDIVDEYAGLREPTCRISRAATRIHGITKKMTLGAELDHEKILSALQTATFVIAHNAGFDYRFVGRLYPPARHKPWVCSMNHIPWSQHGFSSRGLRTLLLAHHLVFPQAHRAMADCRAVLALLNCRDQNDTRYMRHLLLRLR